MSETAAIAAGETLLIVDDIEDNRNLLRRRLDRRGYTVIEAASGPDALALLAEREVSLALLDVTMPEMDGFELLRRIRTIRTRAELPVIMVTARNQSDDILEALSGQASDYITKPIDFALLFSRVEVHLGRMRAERALRDSEERFALAVKACNDGIWDWDLRTNELYLSPRWKELIGFADDELPSALDSWLGRIHPEDRPRVDSAIAATREGASLHLAVEHRVLHRDGSYRWMLARGVGQRSAGVTMRLTGSQTDLTDRKLVDPVTGLPNRAVFQQKLAAAERADNGRGDTSFALLLCNLDRFKLVNDSFGLSLGDQALTAMGRLLRDSVRDVGFLAHLGGDEFAVLVTASCAPAEALQLGDAILEMLRAPLLIGGETIEISASIGIALSTGEGGEAALRDAQVALRRAKEGGGGKAELFEPKMHKDARQRLDLERDLRQAIRGGDLVPNFQPIVSLTDGRIVGFEALARWDRGGGKGMVAPAEFIPVAEETGLIRSVDQHILARACAEARRWHHGHDSGPFVSVNLSAKQVGDPGLVAATLEQIKEHGLKPRDIKLEITESAIMNDPDAAAAVMAELVSHGVGLAIDDFGTGYCSLAYLHRFPADTLKIDRYFVSQMDGGAHGLGIVSAIIDLAHGLGMAVVAEGIETAAQRDALRHLGCDYGQGFLFSRPVAADVAAKLLQESAAA
jgi:diguanylate cyclase (GGDEF)-like protein/PAS domain S-box-containing protein